MAEQTQLKDAPARDEVEVNLGASVAETKVELDLDDAPFLTAETPASTRQAKAPAVVEESSPEEVSKRNKRKKLLILGGAGLLLLLALAVWWFFFRVPPPPLPEAPKPEVIVVPSTSLTQEPKEFIKNLEPFLVPHASATGDVRFLICKFSVFTREARVEDELDRQMLPLRDAVYFYLRSKESAWLMDVRNASVIKDDLKAVLNDYLTQGEAEDILFESYLNE